MFDWHLLLGILSGLISCFAIIPYIIDIIHGTTRPNIVSFSFWALLLAISIIAQISSGSSWSVILLMGDFIGTSTVVVFCLIGYGYKKYGKTELICTILAILAIVSWQVTHQPVLAIVFAVIADLMAAIPTVVKSYRDPESEFPTMWFLISFGAILSILSTTIFNLPNLLFPIYLFLINGTIGVFSLIGRAKQKSIKN